MVMEAERRSGVHHMLLKCSVYITVRLTLWARSCMLSYALKHYCTVLSVVGMGVELGLSQKGITQAWDVRGSSAAEIIWA
jgi:hypothetical protein